MQILLETKESPSPGHSLKTKAAPAERHSTTLYKSYWPEFTGSIQELSNNSYVNEVEVFKPNKNYLLKAWNAHYFTNSWETSTCLLFSRAAVKTSRDMHCRIGAHTIRKTEFSETESDRTVYLRNTKSGEEAKHTYKKPSLSPDFCRVGHEEWTNIGWASYHGIPPPFLAVWRDLG